MTHESSRDNKPPSLRGVHVSQEIVKDQKKRLTTISGGEYKRPASPRQFASRSSTHDPRSSRQPQKELQDEESTVQHHARCRASFRTVSSRDRESRRPRQG